MSSLSPTNVSFHFLSPTNVSLHIPSLAPFVSEVSASHIGDHADRWCQGCQDHIMGILTDALEENCFLRHHPHDTRRRIRTRLHDFTITLSNNIQLQCMLCYSLDGTGQVWKMYRCTWASCKMGTGSFPGVKCGRGVLQTTHPLLVPRSWKSRAIPLPTL